MDGSTFDRLTRAVSRAGSRRRLLGVVASVGLGGLLSALDDEATPAKRKRQGRRNSHRPGKDKDNRKGKRNDNGGGDRDEPVACGAVGSDCRQDSDCCANNCFNLGCADTVPSCGAGSSTTACHPAANGCAGETCCYGEAACGGTCCDGTANQCNRQGECCAPNCAGRQCGPDGCGGGGTCGSCQNGKTCNTQTGQCQGGCTPQCQGKPCGPDGCGGSCGPCPTGQTCCGDVCCPAGNICCGATCCPSAQACCVGECCAEGLTCCGDACTDRQTDPENCGSCDNTCAPGQVCDQGNCCTLATCPAGFCGDMDDGCGGVLTCTCGAGLTCCRVDQFTSACTDLFTDDNNCGVCEDQCPGLETCQNGVCCAGIVCGCAPSGFVCKTDTCCNPGGCPSSGICP